MNRYYFNNFEFQILDGADGFFCTIDWDYSGLPWENQVLWGLSGSWNPDLDLAVASTLSRMAQDREIDRNLVHEAVAGAYALLLVKDGTPLEWIAPRAFVYRGGVWLVCSNIEDPNKPYALGPNNNPVFSPSCFDLAPVERTALALAWVDARSEGEKLAKAYEEPEEKWFM